LQDKQTPWQRVYAKFNARNQSEFASILGCDRSKISRALADNDGVISGRDQRRILQAAKKCGVTLDPVDLIPGV